MMENMYKGEKGINLILTVCSNYGSFLVCSTLFSSSFFSFNIFISYVVWYRTYIDFFLQNYSLLSLFVVTFFKVEYKFADFEFKHTIIQFLRGEIKKTQIIMQNLFNKKKKKNSALRWTRKRCCWWFQVNYSKLLKRKKVLAAAVS